MNHLTIDEILEFVMMEKLDARSLRLASRVNGHILRCDECLEKVKEFQLVCEKLGRIEKEALRLKMAEKPEAEFGKEMKL